MIDFEAFLCRDSMSASARSEVRAVRPDGLCGPEASARNELHSRVLGRVSSERA